MILSLPDFTGLRQYHWLTFCCLDGEVEMAVLSSVGDLLRARTGYAGKPGKPWNLRISFSRPEGHEI